MKENKPTVPMTLEERMENEQIEMKRLSDVEYKLENDINTTKIMMLEIKGRMSILKELIEESKDGKDTH